MAIDRSRNPTDPVHGREITKGDRISWGSHPRQFGEVKRVSATFYVTEIEGSGAYYPVRRGQATREGP